MSFLLGKKRDMPVARVPPPGDRGIGSKGKAIAGRRNNAMRIGGGQMQQLVQRSKSQQQTKETKQQQKTKAAEQELKGVISMEEVMEDLRVLEQQQRESQRKLAAAKLTKQHKMEQQASLESKLSSLKYANGEQRAQLKRSRDVLSRCTRELGNAKLCSGRSADALKAFDNRLKRALLSARTLRVLRRRLDSGMIVLRNKEANIRRLKVEVVEKVEAAEQRRNDAKNREASFREAIHEEKLRAKNLIESTTSIRSDVSGLEQDLAAAQQMAASTKLRAESIAAEIVAEDRRHEREMMLMSSKLEAYKKQEADRAVHAKAKENDIAMKKAEVFEMFIAQYQQEEGLEPCPMPSTDSPLPTVDLESMKKLLEESQEVERREMQKRDDFAAKEAQSREKIASFASTDAAAKEETESMRKSNEAAQKAENNRRQAYEAFLIELEKERRNVSDLRRSVSELEEASGHEQKRLADKLSEQAQAIEKRRDELEETKSSLTAANERIQELEREFESQKSANAQRVEEAKEGGDAARAAFEETRLKVEALENADDADVLKEIEDIQQAQIILVEDTKDTIEELCEEHPALIEIDFVFDPEKSTEEQADEALADIKADCEARRQNCRKHKQAADHKSLAHKNAKEKELAERKARKRAQEVKEAETSKKSKDERKRRSDSQKQEALFDNVTDPDYKADKYISVDAEEEPMSASQKRIRFEDEVMTSSPPEKEVTEPQKRPTTTKKTYGSSSKHQRSSLKGKELRRYEDSSKPSLKRSSQVADNTVPSSKSRSSSKERSLSRSHSTVPGTRPAAPKNRESKEGLSRSSLMAADIESVKTNRSAHSSNTRIVSNISGSSKKDANREDLAYPSEKKVRRKSREPRLEKRSSAAHKSSRESKAKASRDKTKTSRDSKRDLCPENTAQLPKRDGCSERKYRESKPEGIVGKKSRILMADKLTHEGIPEKGQSFRESKRDGKSDTLHKSTPDARLEKDKSPREFTRDGSSDKASRESKRDDRSVSSHRSSSKRKKSSLGTAEGVINRDDRSVSSHKSSTNRKTSLSEAASQASGASTSERAPKSRRRKKSAGSISNKAKAVCPLPLTQGMQDYDFRF